MLRLVIGRDWVTIRNEILHRISTDVSQERSGRILMVPELISHDTERRLCAAAGDTASRFAEVLSFTRLARRVSEHTHCPVPQCLDNGGRVVAMAAAARQMHSKLKSFASVETKPEFLTGLLDAVDEFKRCAITPADLMEAARRSEGTLAQKLEELSLLLEAYDAICSRGKRDPRDQMTWLLEWLQECEFAREHVFYIDGFPDFTRQHFAILEHLIRESPEVTVGINCDTVGSKLLAFEKAGDTAAALVRCAKNAGVEVAIQTVDQRDIPLTHMCDALFQGKLPTPDTVCGSLWAFRTNSVFDEIQLTAEKILELVRGGCRYRDISVVCADPAGYQNAIDMVFGRFKIPAYQSGTEDILQKTVIHTVLSALDAALGGFEQRDVLRYLKSLLSPLDPDICDRLENYVILWSVRGKRWETDWLQHPDGFVDAWDEDARNRLKQLNEARIMALSPLFVLSERFRTANNLAEQVEALYAFLEEISLADRLCALAEEMESAGDHRNAQILNQLWEILLSALEQLHSMLGDCVWDGDTFTRLLTLLLSQYDVGTIPPVLDAVTVGSVSAMRCQEAKHLFVLGCAEGVMPSYGSSSGILSNQEREQLRACGLTLTGGGLEGLQAEFAEIYGVFRGTEESVCVSCPEGQPSYVFNRLAQMAGSAKPFRPGPGSALADSEDAAAYLVKWNAAEAACVLHLEELYANTKEKVSFDMGAIGKDNVRSLYGGRLNLSASQIDRQAECRMSYFLKYGMRAKERKEATVDPAEFGTYVHAVLEKTAEKVMELGGFHRVSLEKTLELALQYSEEYANEKFRDMDSQRIAYLFRRNRRELEMVVTELWQELKGSRFQPERFELAFGDNGSLPAIDVPARSMEAALRGFVDRVDLWQENGQNYFRVVDYKTGRKDFDYCDVFNGVGLQMLLYLFALEQAGDEILGADPKAAGVQYFPARVPIVSADGAVTEAEAEAIRLKDWKRKGLLLNDEAVLEAMEPGGEMKRLCCARKKDGSISGDLADREQLKMLRSYVFGVLSNMVDEIASGNVTPNPYTRGTSHDACAFCPYGAICHRNSVQGRRNYKTMTAQRFWEDVEKEVSKRG